MKVSVIVPVLMKKELLKTTMPMLCMAQGFLASPNSSPPPGIILEINS